MRTVRALGTQVEVDLGERIDVDEFDAAWSRCLVGADEVCAGSGSPAGDDSRRFVAGPRATMSLLTQAITQELIARRRGELLMLHAGAVCSPSTGDAVAFIAPGGTGKTTLVRLLARRYGYLTDETVGVDPATRRILPYPKPLSIRSADGGHAKLERGPDELGLLPAHPDARLTALVILRRTGRRGGADLTRLDLFDAITALVPETSSLPALDRPLHLLAELERELGGIWLAEYDEASRLLDWFEGRLDG